jgi:hypothetical protein
MLLASGGEHQIKSDPRKSAEAEATPRRADTINYRTPVMSAARLSGLALEPMATVEGEPDLLDALRAMKEEGALSR